MAPYPTAHEIEEIFFHRINTDEFHKHLADHIDITVAGTDFNISGHFKSMEEFHDKIYVRINAAIKQETLRLEINRVIGGGESPWAAVETHYQFESKEGREYKMETVDLVRFNRDGKIVRMKEFLDGVGTHQLLEEHEKKLAEGTREHAPVASNAWAQRKGTTTV